jgi:hypothetical protein
VAELPGLSYCTIQEAQELLGLSEAGVRKAILRGDLGGFRLGKRRYIWLEEIAAFPERIRLKRKLANIKGGGNHRHAKPHECPMCGLKTKDGGLCAYCRNQKAGHRYYVLRDIPPAASRSCPEGLR